MSTIIRLSIILLCSSFFLNLAALANPRAENSKDFTYKVPKSSEIDRTLTLWATYYYLPIYDNNASGYPLLDLDGGELGANLNHKDWCMSALEGSVVVRFGAADQTVYNYAGFGEQLQVDCQKYYPYKKSGKIRFRIANGPYGDGADETDYILFPYRTIAVDSSFIPFGSLLYIPAARGIKVSLKNGKVFTHDGYFFAADKGGAIKGNHIDVFQGVQIIPEFQKFVKSREDKTFKAYVVKNQKIREALNWAHLKESDVLRPGDF